FSALTCWTLYRIAGRIYGPGVARATAWTWAVFPYLIYWPVRVVWEVTFTTFLLSLVLWVTMRMADGVRRRDWIILGLLWGLIALTNTAVIILLPFYLAWLIYELPACTRRFSGAAICLLLVLLCSTP